ncbi:MAG: MFS transporter [Candidatus Latescibacterota bacterium]
MPKQMNTESPPRRHREMRGDLSIIFVEGVAYSVMVGIGESYLPAFVLALGMGEVASGLIATIPLVAGGILQLLTPSGVRLVGSHRRWAVICASVQAAAFIPLVIGALVGAIPGILVFMISALYWASGMAIGPVWNVWVERLIPTTVRTRYFARRTSAANFGILAGLLTGGFILDRISSDSGALIGFAVLFAIASVFRFTSAALLRAQHQPDFLPMPGQPRATVGLMRKFPSQPGSALLIYMLAITFTSTIASPFFTAFMLRSLDMSYSTYMALFVTALAAKVITLPFFGRLARRFGLKWLLKAAWLGIASVPILWLVSSSYVYLTGLQILAGAAWGAQEYVTLLLLLEMIDAKHRGTLLTAYNFGFAICSAGGSLLGGFVFETIGGGTAGYYTIFGLSSIARASCLIFLLRIPGVRFSSLPVVFRSIAARPAAGMILRPILATLHAHTDKEHPDETGSKDERVPH